MTRQPIHTTDAPAAIGPYSQAIIANGFVFVSGQTPLDPASGVMVTGDVSVQTARALDNLAAILTAAGTSLANVVKTTVFLHSTADFAAMNIVYAARFGDTPPARSTVGGLELPRGALVEIEAIALLPG
ncbi:MAG: RidA family protein [Aggregatilineales bacterium]